MPRQVNLAAPFIGLLALPLLLAGCGRHDEDTATTQYAKDTLGVKEAGKERSVESKRQVIVEDTKKVIDANTGEVLKTEDTKTPVTITEQKTIERDVKVKPGATQKTVK